MPETNNASAHQPTASREQLLAKLPDLAAKISEQASQRDLERELPFEAFRLFRESGLGALRIPVGLGGPGGSVADLIEMIAVLSAADSNVAHALRTHFNFTEQLLLTPHTAKSQFGLDYVLKGAIFGGAHTEQGGPKAGVSFGTTLTKEGEAYRLNGRKWYATGTAYADFGTFTAVEADGSIVRVLIPVTRPGVTILDDWDGMGQKLTASGGITFENVHVFPEEISRRASSDLINRHTSTLRQLHLAACAGGIVRNVLADATSYVRRQARAAAHSAAASASEDPFVQMTVGRIAGQSFAVDAAIAAAAEVLETSASVILAQESEEKIDQQLIASAVATARAQSVLDVLALGAAELLFETGGGSATSRKHNFDRHWRNIRTLLNHNPLNHKARVLGDYYINDVTTHLREGKVF